MASARNTQPQAFSWNHAIENFLFDDFDSRFEAKFPNYSFKQNIDFIKLLTLNYGRLLYFANNNPVIRDKIMANYFEIFFTHKAVAPYSNDENFKKYLQETLTYLLTQLELIIEKYLKSDLANSINMHGYLGSKNYAHAIKALFKGDLYRLGLTTDYSFDQSKLDNFLQWAERTLARKKKTDRAALLNGYHSIIYGSFAAYFMGLGFSQFGFSWLGYGLMIPSAFLMIVYALEAGRARLTDSFSISKTMVNIADSLVHIQFKITKQKKIHLDLTLTTDPRLLGITITEVQKPLSGHTYKLLLPPLQEPALAPVVAAESVQTDEPLGLIDTNHYRFKFNNRIIDAYLDADALPQDKFESEAVVKAFQKGLLTTAKNKTVHAIVYAGVKNNSSFFKIKTSYDARMESSMVEAVDAEHATIHFNHYNRNAHKSRRSNM
jgi:hypothetical protein